MFKKNVTVRNRANICAGGTFGTKEESRIQCSRNPSAFNQGPFSPFEPRSSLVVPIIGAAMITEWL